MNALTRFHAASRDAWIPPLAMMAAQAAHGLSWILLFALGALGIAGPAPAALAWVHVVALGWLTTVSLAVLFHVIPGVLDLEWRGGRVARWAVGPVWLGAIAMSLGFWLANFTLVCAGAVVVGLSLAVYLACAAATLVQFRRGPDASISVLRAFSIVLTALALTAGLGVVMAVALARGGDVGGLPSLHAHLGTVGWLSLLVVGVSARTVRRITGGAPDGHLLHILAATLLLGALFPLAAGYPLVAAAMGLVGGAAHALELGVMVRRAKVPHRPPQAFIASAGLYLVVAAGLGLGVALGHAEWQAAYVFVALAGWLGQMVNGHVHHIGVRLLATLVRGDDDETEPVEILSPALSWGAYAASQLAVGLGAVALLVANPLVLQAAGVCGLVGWGLMAANGRHAYCKMTLEASVR